MSLLKKQTFYRKAAKSAKKINNAPRKVKSIGERLEILNFILKNLSVLRVFAVRKTFLQCSHEWEFENQCWVISNLSRVTQELRVQFTRTYDRLFALFQSEFESYAYHSEKLRTEFTRRKRRFPLLHRNGKSYLVSPASERIKHVDMADLPMIWPYQ